jgi:hypothetical protein
VWVLRVTSNLAIEGGFARCIADGSRGGSRPRLIVLPVLSVTNTECQSGMTCILVMPVTFQQMGIQCPSAHAEGIVLHFSVL